MPRHSCTIEDKMRMTGDRDCPNFGTPDVLSKLCHHECSVHDECWEDMDEQKKFYSHLASMLLVCNREDESKVEKALEKGQALIKREIKKIKGATVSFGGMNDESGYYEER